MNVKNIFDLTDKTVILTGAAGYLGGNYADGLSQSGANVVLADINYQGCKKLEHKIREKYDVDPLSVKLDLTQSKSINNLVSKITKKYSGIDVLINNAAYQGTPKIRTAGFENLTLETWNQAISVNLTGIFLLSQQIGKIMKKNIRSDFFLSNSENYHAVHPPSIIKFEPVMYEEASDARNIKAPTYSSFLAILPIMVFLE